MYDYSEIILYIGWVGLAIINIYIYIYINNLLIYLYVINLFNHYY